MDEVEEIKHRIDIVDFISQYVSLKKAGANFKALCPFHQERTSSFMVSADKQIYKCFGCGEGGDIFEFLMKMENLEFPEALEILANRAGVIIERKNKKQYEKTKNEKNRLYKINNLSAKVFHKILLEHLVGKYARDYLRSRKVDNQTLTDFSIGYAPKKPILREFLISKGFSDLEISQAGGPDKFHDRIIFPIFDVMGNVAGFTGRVLDPQNQPKYLNSPETKVFHKSRVLYGLNLAKMAIKEKKSSLIVEGQMDVVLSHQAKVKNVVASSGTSLTEDHLYILSRYGPNVIFAFDQDEAGEKASKKSLEMAIKMGLNAKMVILPSGFKDAGEVVFRDPKLWQEIVATPLDALEWLIKSSFSRFKRDLKAQEKKEIAKEILPFVKLIRDKIEQTHWLKILAKKLDVPSSVITDSLARINQGSFSQKQAPSTKNNLSVEENLVGLLLAYPEEISKFVNELDYKEFSETKEADQIYKFMQSCYTKSNCLTREKKCQLDKDLFDCMKKKLPSFLVKKAKLLALEVENSHDLSEEKNISEDIKQSISRIKGVRREKIKKDFAVKISQAEKAGDRKGVKKLLEEFQYAISKKEQ